MFRNVLQRSQWRSVAAALATAASVSSFVTPSSSSPTPDRTLSSSRRIHPIITPTFHPLYTTTSCHSQRRRGMQVDDSYYYEQINHSEINRTASENHIIFGHLLQPNLLERYNVYKRTPNPETTTTTFNNHDSPFQEIVVADIRLGKRLDGHEGVVHGGILALLLDDTMGYAFEAMGVSYAVTANLHIDYRLPVPANTLIIIRVYLKEQVGRKLYFEADISCPNDSSKVYAEASSLFIIPKEHYDEEEEQPVAA